MATPPRHPRPAQAGAQAPRHEESPSRKKAGRPPGLPSTIVNVRLPVALLARLDRYIDRLETRTGGKANRGMITRQALERFLETHDPG